jgi:hypothetical protein
MMAHQRALTMESSLANPTETSMEWSLDLNWVENSAASLDLHSAMLKATRFL